MKKFLMNIFLFLLLFIFFPETASADLVNPEYYTKTCSPGEVEVECSYKSTQPFGPTTYDECAKYKNDPDYRYLVEEGHSFGGSQKYCFKAVSPVAFFLYHVKTLLPLLFITLLLEVPLFLLFVRKGRKALLAVLFANLVSVPLLYLITIFLPFSGYMLVIFLELLVVIFEALFIKRMLNEIMFKKLITYSFVANAVSAIFGSAVLLFISALLLV
ncbi:MAG: hypothetical protein NUV98_07435 [Candidatus Roizmanbacteria bacterium]|nr:hypothetical protein [Candidatus Roizmanbacteria bacterium]